MEKKTNSTGFAGVITNMASFNNELDLNSSVNGSRQTVSGDFYATHFKMKWLIRNYYSRILGDKSVLVKSSYINKDGSLVARKLEDRIQFVFGLDDKTLKAKTTVDLLNLILTKKDVKNFGAAIPLKSKQIQLTGVTQLSYAVNNYKDTEEYTIGINSAYGNSSKENQSQTTNGTRKFLDFANYIYNFTVQPNMLSEDVLGISVDSYTEEDYAWFKKGMLRSVQTNQSSTTGSYTGYAMFLDLKEGEDVIQPNFNNYISTEKIGDHYVIDFSKLVDYIRVNQDSIDMCELYLVDNIQLEFKGTEDLRALGVHIRNMSESRAIEVVNQ